mgnify:CR=1 FL=1|jgi:hypothetical protein
MDTKITTLQDTLKIGYEAYEESREEAREVWNMYHNRQYTDEQIAVLKNRGQPVETFNVIKLFARMLIGYYSTVLNTVKVSPEQMNDIPTASVLNDLVKHTMRVNNFDTEGDKLKLSGLVSGIMCSYIDVEDTGEKDVFGRNIRQISINHVPDSEIVLDPLSRLEDYSDARFLHRYRWLSDDQVVKLFGKEKLEELLAYENHLGLDESEFSATYNGEFTGRYKVFDNYLIVHTVITDDEDKTWSIFWSGDVELERKEITYKEVRFPYRVQKLHTSDNTEHYGIFREVVETQKAINQALIKIQLMVNTQKAFIEANAVEDMAEFIDAFNRVNAVIPVRDLQGIKIENMNQEIINQYVVIDKALDRIQRILSINDSFLGMAYASDSGRKVKLQQNATVVALRYLTNRIDQFYQLLGWDIVNLMKQYYTAFQVIRIADEISGDRWVAVNQPMQMPTGRIGPNGQPEMEFAFEFVIDPASGEREIDSDGNYIVAPIPEESTEIAFTNVDISVESVSYNDEDEKTQLMLESILAGPVGQMLAQTNPAGFMQAASLGLRTMKTKYSPEISGIFEQTAMMLSQNQQAQMQAMQGAQGLGGQPGSQDLKLPQNTNEGA